MKQLTLLLFILPIWIFSQNIVFTDPALKAKLLQSAPSNIIAQDTSGNFIAIDSNDDNEISLDEALQIAKLRIPSSNITSLNDLQYFPNLTMVDADYNTLSSLSLINLNYLVDFSSKWSSIETIDISGAPNLVSLILNNNNITAINLSNNSKLQTLNLDTNFLTSINLQNNTDLKYFFASYTMINTVDFTNNSALISVIMQNGELETVLFGSEYPTFKNLNLSFNQLAGLNVSGLQALEKLLVSYNNLINLDTSQNFNLHELTVTGNVLEYLNLKNGHNITTGTENFINYQDNPIQIICADENEIFNINQLNDIYGYSGVIVTSFCSLEPGGDQNVIKGRTVYDENINGCDADDPAAKYVKLQLSNSTGTIVYYTDYDGNYQIPVEDGTHQLSVDFAHPYYTVTPQSVTVNFPEQSTPFIQNFCIAPVGNISDVKVIMVPQTSAEPGKYLGYDLYLINQGVNTVSGTMTLDFDNTKVIFHLANPYWNNFQNQTITWNYENLEAFEIRKYYVTFRVHDTDETDGPVQPGDVLIFTVNAPVADEETPDDNTFILAQDVLPEEVPLNTNCLEGQVVSADKIGDFVNYQIMFKNSGTSTVAHLKIRDVLDNTKFVIESLTPTASSHLYRTELQRNTAEFLFENINLQPNATGYITFQIKLKPTLLPGESFQNSAEIFLDFNTQPQQTNSYTSIIQETMSTEDLNSSSDIQIYPNPASEILHIKSGERMMSVAITDVSGKNVIIKNEANTKATEVNLRSLASGLYWIRIQTDKGITTKKLLKK